MGVFVHKLVYLLCFYITNLIFITFARSLQYMFYLCYCNYREVFGKQEKTGKKQSKSTSVKTYFKNTGAIVNAPAAWQIVSEKRCNYNHETLEPHTNIYNNTHKESYKKISAHFSEPENLWA